MCIHIHIHIHIHYIHAHAHTNTHKHICLLLHIRVEEGGAQMSEDLYINIHICIYIYTYTYIYTTYTHTLTLTHLLLCIWVEEGGVQMSKDSAIAEGRLLQPRHEPVINCRVHHFLQNMPGRRRHRAAPGAQHTFVSEKTCRFRGKIWIKKEYITIVQAAVDTGLHLKHSTHLSERRCVSSNIYIYVYIYILLRRTTTGCGEHGEHGPTPGEQYSMMTGDVWI